MSKEVSVRRFRMTMAAGLAAAATLTSGAVAHAQFAPAAGLSSPDKPPSYPQVAFDGADNAVAVWVEGEFSGVAKAAFRPDGGTFSAPVTISGRSFRHHYQPSLAVDAAGAAIVTWPAPEGAQVIVRP